MMNSRLLGFLLLVCWLSTPPLFAAEAGSSAPRGSVAVTADSLEADENSGTMVFIGNAVASQDDMTIHADRLTVDVAIESREVRTVIAAGHVRIVQEQREATAERAVFDRLEERITLTGNPRVSEAGNYIEGKEIVLFLKDRRSVVVGGEDGRVNAVFQPERKAAP